jgi:aminoglycoside 6-adenylyltransferase
MLDFKPAREVIETITQWAMAKPDISAVLLTSTRAVPDAPVDKLSDYDVILIVQDIEPFVSNRNWLNDFGELLVAYWDTVYPHPKFVTDCCGNVVQYVSGLKIDFTLWSVKLFKKMIAAPELDAELDAGYKILLDKDGLSASMKPPTFKAYRPIPPSLEAYQKHINDFLTDAPYVAKCLWRGELLPAKWALDHDMKQIYLRQLLEWRVGLNDSVAVGSLGKGLKKHLPSDIWDALEETYAGAKIEDNWMALEKTMQLFRRVAREVGMKLGYDYPEVLHEKVKTYLWQIKEVTT